MKKVEHWYIGLVCLLLSGLVAMGFAPGSGDMLHNARAASTAPMTTTMGWQVAIPAGGLDDIDAATVTNFGTLPTFTGGNITDGTGLVGGDLATNATAGTRKILCLKGVAGTTLIWCVKYPAATAAGTALTFVVAGCGQDSADHWQPLLQVGTAARSITIVAKSTDISDGTWRYTDVDIKTHAMDNIGSWAIVPAVQATGFGSTAVLMVKGI